MVNKIKIKMIVFCFNQTQNENRALRLREDVTVSHFQGVDLSASTSPNSNHLGSIGSYSSSDTAPQLSWDYFDEQGYIKRGGLRVSC